ncbi:zinc finger protein 410-like [Dreissena polymorpha]|nr:zinc finger protein 410-like [Dreissena polymorpha]
MMQNLKDSDGDKPFACPVPGCKKRYKNVNGMKYHARHGHRKDPSLFCRVKKAFKCKCGKSYRTSHKLRAHMIVHHSTSDLLKQGTPVSLTGTGIGSVMSIQKVSASAPVMTNAVFSMAAPGNQSCITTGAFPGQSLNLVPVTVTTTKQGQITLTSTGATLQLIGCPQAEMMTTESKAE